MPVDLSARPAVDMHCTQCRRADLIAAGGYPRSMWLGLYAATVLRGRIMSLRRLGRREEHNMSSPCSSCPHDIQSPLALPCHAVRTYTSPAWARLCITRNRNCNQSQQVYQTVL